MGVLPPEGLGRPPGLPMGVSLHPGGGWQDPPEIHGILLGTVNKRAVGILLECFLVIYIFEQITIYSTHKVSIWKCA